MSANILVDTNVLVYAYDRAAGVKQQQALDVLDELIQRSAGAITTQVLAEFFVTVTRKLAAPLSITDAYLRVENYLRAWTVYDLTGLIVLEAARGVRDYQLSFWDAQIWAVARLNQIPVVFSEDFNVGATLDGVRFVNPFDSAFQITDWV
jgi:predicted nucleic acid-binding protein